MKQGICRRRKAVARLGATKVFALLERPNDGSRILGKSGFPIRAWPRNTEVKYLKIRDLPPCFALLRSGSSGYAIANGTAVLDGAVAEQLQRAGVKVKVADVVVKFARSLLFQRRRHEKAGGPLESMGFFPNIISENGQAVRKQFDTGHLADRRVWMEKHSILTADGIQIARLRGLHGKKYGVRLLQFFVEAGKKCRAFGACVKGEEMDAAAVLGRDGVEKFEESAGSQVKSAVVQKGTLGYDKEVGLAVRCVLHSD